jgi:transcriptional regulator with XRE-family HTH domain
VTEKEIKLLEDALIEWRARQTRKRGSVSLNKFANYLGVSRSLLSMWLSGERTITQKSKVEISEHLAGLLGNRVYKLFNVPSPDPALLYISNSWDDLTPEQQNEVSAFIKAHITENKKKEI